MTKQNRMMLPTSGQVNKMGRSKAGTLLLLLLCFVFASSVLVRAGPVRVKKGDWIRYDSINIGEIPFISGTAWSKVEVLNVSETTATIQVTMNRTDGTEQIRTTRINVASDSQSSSGFSGFVIATDLSVGDVFRVGGWGNVTITGEATRTYAGASRTVVYAPYSETAEVDGPEVETISYWDKQTGIFLEETATSATYTMSFKATETNMWSTSASGIFDWQLLISIIIPIAAIIAVTVLFIHRRKKPTASQSQNELPPSSDQSSIQE